MCVCVCVCVGGNLCKCVSARVILFCCVAQLTLGDVCVCAEHNARCVCVCVVKLTVCKGNFLLLCKYLYVIDSGTGLSIMLCEGVILFCCVCCVRV